MLSQLLGIFYRWYFGLAGGAECLRLAVGQRRAASLGRDGACLEASDRILWPILLWLVVGLVAVLAWVIAAKANRGHRRSLAAALAVVAEVPRVRRPGRSPPASASCSGLLPFLLHVLWDPVEGNAIVTNVVAIAGAVGSAGAVFRLLRRPLAKVAPVLGGLLFALVLAVPRLSTGRSEP